MPNPFVSRALTVVYALGASTEQQIGGTSSLVLDGVFLQDLKYASGRFKCRFWVAEKTDAAFAATCSAVEANLTLPRQRLTIIVNGVILEDWNPDPTINTGFNQRVQLTKPDDPMNTTRTRLYEWVCEFDRPATLAGQAGRLESTVNLAVEPGGRRRLSVTGTYTALGTNSGRQQYEAAIGGPAYNGGVGTGYLGLLTDGFGGSWEIVNTPQVAADDTDKILRFSVELRDLLLAESVQTLRDPDLTDQVLTLRRSWTAPGDSQGGVPPPPADPSGGGSPQSGVVGSLTVGFQTIDVDAFTALFGPGGTVGRGSGSGGGGSGNVRRLQTIDVDYSVWVVGRNNDGTVKDLRTKWESSIVPWILKHVTTVAQLSVYAVTRIAPQFDYVNARISASLQFLAPNGSNLLTQTITTSDDRDYGVAEAPVWSGDTDAKYLFQGPTRSTRTISFTSSFLGGPTQPPPSPAKSGYTLLRRNVTNTAVTLGGFKGLGQFDICNQTISEVWIFSTAPKQPTAPPQQPNRSPTPGSSGNGPGIPETTTTGGG